MAPSVAIIGPDRATETRKELSSVRCKARSEEKELSGSGQGVRVREQLVQVVFNDIVRVTCDGVV